jgi:hypothetical protein
MPSCLPLLASLAGAATLEPHPGGFLVADGPIGAVLDVRRGRIRQIGPVETLRPEGSTSVQGWLHRHDVVVARRGAMDAVVGRGALRTRSQGYQTSKTWIPDHWHLDDVSYTFTSQRAVALYDGELLIPGERRRPDLYRVDAAAMIGSGDVLFFPDRPEKVFDVLQRRLVDTEPVVFEQVRHHVGGFVGLHEGRVVLWDDEGRVTGFGATDDTAVARVGPTGRQLATRSTDAVVDLKDLVTGETLYSAAVCPGTPWPHDDGTVTVDCGDRLLFVGSGTQRTLARPEGPLRRVTRHDDHLSLIVGTEGIGDVVHAPLDGGPIVHRHGPVSGEVQGYRHGSPVRLAVTTIDGRPVERATAAAYRRMARAAAADGVTLEVRSGFRTWDEQAALYDCYQTGDCNNGNLAARPGHSRHQSGNAVDLNTHVPAVRVWLDEHAATHGFRRTVRSEPWHWEYDGPRASTAVRVVQLPPSDPPPLRGPAWGLPVVVRR